MDYFLSQLNPRRLAAGYKPYDHRRLGKLLEGIETKDLYALKSKCDDSSNWGRTFHYTLNPEKYERKQMHAPSSPRNHEAHADRTY